MKHIAEYITNYLRFEEVQTIEEAFDACCNEMQKNNWWVAKSKEDLLTYTYSEDYSEISDSDSCKISLREIVPSQQDVFEAAYIKITEYSNQLNTNDFAYIVELYDEDDEFFCSSINE